MKKWVFLLIVTTCGILPTSQAQSLTDLLKGNVLGEVANNLLAKSTLTPADLAGTWAYTSPACVFESDDLLKKAGGAVAASQLTEKLEGVYSAVGLKPGTFDFTFVAEDSSFTSKLGDRTLQGKFDTGDGTITLHYTVAGLIKTGSIEVHTQKTGNQLSMLFEADKLLSLLSTICSLTQNATLLTIAKIVDGYDGLLIGFELQQ